MLHWNFATGRGVKNLQFSSATQSLDSEGFLVIHLWCPKVFEFVLSLHNIRTTPTSLFIDIKLISYAEWYETHFYDVLMRTSHENLLAKFFFNLKLYFCRDYKKIVHEKMRKIFKKLEANCKFSKFSRITPNRNKTYKANVKFSTIINEKICSILV